MFKHLSFRYFVCYDPYNLQLEINPSCLYYTTFCLVFSLWNIEYRLQQYLFEKDTKHTHTKILKNFVFHLRTYSLGLVFELKSTGVLIFHLLESRFENCTCKSKYTRFCFVCKHATHFYVRLQHYIHVYLSMLIKTFIIYLQLSFILSLIKLRYNFLLVVYILVLKCKLYSERTFILKKLLIFLHIYLKKKESSIS